MAETGKIDNGAGLLERILRKKEEEIASLPESAPFSKSNRGRFASALRRQRGSAIRVIAECKKASPSTGILRKEYHPDALAREYARAGASALSILTDREFFQGDPHHIGLAKCAGLPILRKDFIISEKQVFESARLGADAILLIVRLLEVSRLRDLLLLSHSLGMDVLIEIHTPAEMEMALKSGGEIFGINHRDLDTLKIDLTLTEQLSPIIRNAFPSAIIVAESGVESREGRMRVDPFADALLIGTGLLKAADIEFAWKNIFS